MELVHISSSYHVRRQFIRQFDGIFSVNGIATSSGHGASIAARFDQVRTVLGQASILFVLTLHLVQVVVLKPETCIRYFIPNRLNRTVLRPDPVDVRSPTTTLVRVVIFTARMGQPL